MISSLKPNMWFTFELRRWIKAPALWVITLLSAGMAVLSTFGTIETGAKNIEDGLTDAAGLTELSLTMPFAGVLFTTFLAIVIVGSDFDTKFSNRLRMLSSNAVTLIVVKSIVASLLSFIVGAATLAAGRVATERLLEAKDIAFTPQMEVVEWAQGYLLLYVSGALWGVAVALLFRNSIVAMGVHFIYQTVAESSIIGAFPKVGKWLPGGAQAAMVQDPSLPERLDILPGIGVFALWLVALFALSVFILSKSPQPPAGLMGRIGKKRESAVEPTTVVA
ncbi:MAG: hypothetical protein Q4E01_03565 [Actinomycetaceae bacterium]|nr:hypothetical protein [Actinomycetaceae bacterium]